MPWTPNVLFRLCFAVSAVSSVSCILTMSVSSTTKTTNENLKSRVRSEDLHVPDHLEGVRLERDGHLNTRFRQEVILGRRNQQETALLKKHPEKLLTRVFRRADKDRDGELTVAELSAWISERVTEHLEQAIRGNIHVFMALDKDHDGLVTWDEYHSRFLLEQGYGADYIKNHSEKHKDMSRQVREEILLDQASFQEAAHTNPDGLNIDEFLSFRHPEHSHATLLAMVQDIFERLDTDGNDALTVTEFAALRQDDMAQGSPRMVEEVWAKERRREFEEVIDADKDGNVTRQELLMYSDPKNPAHAVMEAKGLVDAADSDRNGRLSLREVLKHKELFLGSKMVDIAKKFHDEF